MRIPVLVSIHARTGRATSNCSLSRVSHVVSIHARTGRATSIPVLAPPAPQFQFTRARGARPSGSPSACSPSGFNSRAHGARDVLGLHPARPRAVSIHARTGRATVEVVGGRMVWKVSIHARTGRATQPEPVRHILQEFQFTRARGARRLRRRWQSIRHRFNSRAPGARDKGLQESLQHGIDVSIHARTGRATCCM